MFFFFFVFFFYFGTLADGSYHLASTAWAAQRVPWTVDVIFFFFFFELCDVSCVSVRSRPTVQYSEKTTKKKAMQPVANFPPIESTENILSSYLERFPSYVVVDWTNSFCVCVPQPVVVSWNQPHSRLLLATYLCVCSHRFVSVSLFLDKRPLTAV